MEIHNGALRGGVLAVQLETPSGESPLETGCLVNKHEYCDRLPGEERLLGETVLLGAGGKEGFSPNLEK